MSRARWMLALALLAGPARPALADQVVVANKRVATLDCAKDAAIAIRGDRNTIHVVGTCTSISIAGDRNEVTVVAAGSASVLGNSNTLAINVVDAIEVSGNKNSVSYRGAARGGKPSIAALGRKNSIRQAP